METVGRKSIVFIIENSKACQAEYLRALSDIATIKQAFTIKDAEELLVNEFKKDVILVIDGTITNHLDGLHILNLALVIAKNNRFHPMIIASSSTENDNKRLLEEGCTHNAGGKMGVIKIIRNLHTPREGRNHRNLSLR